ncbi:hypothetical protein C9439_06650 [archaeon SCG-AAA382B04]|nr:hypothetical protein C9439_06650 [archaeon SCG-AAA382B04]
MKKTRYLLPIFLLTISFLLVSTPVVGQTNSTENLKADIHHITMQYSEPQNSLIISQVVNITNMGNETYIGEFPIDKPEDMTTMSSSGNNTTVNLGPEESVKRNELYITPFNDSFRFSLNIEVETQNLIILMSPENLNGSNPKNIVDMGINSMGNQSYRTYSGGMMGGSISSGSEIALTVEKTTQTSNGEGAPNEDPDNQNSWLLPALLAAAVIIGFVAYSQREKLSVDKLDLSGSGSQEKIDTDQISVKSLKRRKKSLLKKIDNLDEKYEEGDIREKRYNEKRNSYKDDLTQVMKKLEMAGATEEETEEESKEKEKSELERKKEELLEKIDNLEKRLENDEISEEEYEILDERYREKLKDVMKKLED